MSNFLSSTQQPTKAITSSFAPFIHQRLANRSDNTPPDLNVSSEQLEWEFNRYPISASTFITLPWDITSMLGRKSEINPQQSGACSVSTPEFITSGSRWGCHYSSVIFSSFRGGIPHLQSNVVFTSCTT